MLLSLVPPSIDLKVFQLEDVFGNSLKLSLAWCHDYRVSLINEGPVAD